MSDQHLPIPDAALDGRLAIVGLSGSGKSTTAKGGVERLLTLGRRVCIVDLLDGWWGLRLKRDGKTAAFPVAIFGGRHGDLPLTEHAGALIGQAVAQSQESSIVSLYDLADDASRRRFALAFFDSLHRHNRAPLHLVIDEADFYAPQNPVKDGPGPMLLNRVKEIAARGRMRGFRCWLISQRPAKLHKDALSQADTLIAMQLTSSQDRDAIEAWIGDQADKITGKQILATLPRFKRGHGVLWSPRLDILAPTEFPLPETYDSSRTPEYGEELPDVDLTPIDLGALREKLATVETETKENDPKRLKAKIAELERQRRSASAEPDPTALDRAMEAGRFEGYKRGKIEGYRDGLRSFEPLLPMLKEARRAAGVLAEFGEKMDKWITANPADTAVPRADHRVVGSSAHFQSLPPPRPQRSAGDALPGPQQRILDALAWWESVGIAAPRRVQVAVAAGYSPEGGAFQNPLGALRSAGLIDYPQPGTATLTNEGRRHAAQPEEAATSAALHAKVMAILDGPKRRILEPLLRSYPRALSREGLALAAGYEPSGGAFQNPLGSLRSLGLIDYPERGRVVALPVLFIEGQG